MKFLGNQDDPLLKIQIFRLTINKIFNPDLCIVIVCAQILSKMLVDFTMGKA